MIDIALLGGVSVNVGGVQLAGEAAQRRRVALLALLAAPALRPVSRDRLIGWLWPDHDPESARHLLSAALHVLRKALGPDALLTTGDDVALNPAVVAVDAAAFRAAVAGGDVEGALALYGGEFMEGFFVNDAGDFAQWVDGERDELKRLYGETLERAAAARAAAGNTAGAAEAWRRRAAVDPYDARVALELMKALAASGQRGAAIQHARLHAQLLEQEFGAEPDRAVEALAATLKQAPADPGRAAEPKPVPAPAIPPVSAATEGVADTTPGTAAAVAAPPVPAESPAPGPASEPAVRPPRGRGWRRMAIPLGAAAVLIPLLVFAWSRNRTTTAADVVIGVRPCTSDEASLAAIGPGLAEEVMTELGRLERVQLVALDVSFPTAGMVPREAIRRMKADVILDCRLHSGGGQTNAHLYLTRGDGLNELTDEVTGRNIPELEHAILARLAEHYRQGFSPETPAEQAADAVDPDAIAHYLAGRTAYLERTPAALDVALRRYYRAIQIDPKYAKAWAGLADAYNMLGSYDYAGLAPKVAYPRAEKAARQALRLDRKLADAFAALANTQANYGWDWRSAQRNYRKAMSLPGGHTTASEWYALLLAARGRFREARKQTLAAVEQEPSSPLSRVNQAHVLYYAGDFEEARSAVRHALELDPTFNRANVLDALIDLASGEKQQALMKFSRFRALTPKPEPILVALLGYAHVVNGQADSARAALRWLSRVSAEGRQYVPPELLAAVHTALGEKDAAFAELERAYEDHSSGMMYLRVEPLIAPLRSDPRYQELVDLVERAH